MTTNGWLVAALLLALIAWRTQPRIATMLYTALERLWLWLAFLLGLAGLTAYDPAWLAALFFPALPRLIRASRSPRLGRAATALAERPLLLLGLLLGSYLLAAVACWVWRRVAPGFPWVSDSWP